MDGYIFKKLKEKRNFLLHKNSPPETFQNRIKPELKSPRRAFNLCSYSFYSFFLSALCNLIFLMLLPFFPEIRQSKTCRRLILSLSSEACENQNDDCYKVRQHLEDLLGTSSDARNIEIQDVKTAKEDGTPDGI